MTTSSWHPNPADWKHPRPDLANEHFYIRPDDNGEAWKDEVAMVLERARLLLEETPPGRPAMLGEFGLATKDWRQSPHMEKDASLAHFHNCLWASALSGLSGAAMFWWWDALARMDAYRHYKPLAEFMARVPLSRADLAPTKATASDKRVRVVGLQGGDCAYLWLFDAEANWYRTIVEQTKPSEVRGAALIVSGLAAGAYSVEWLDTRTGGILERGTETLRDNTVTLNPPTFARDLACRVTRRP